MSSRREPSSSGVAKILSIYRVTNSLVMTPLVASFWALRRTVRIVSSCCFMQTEVTWAVNNWKKGNSAYQKAALTELQKLFYTLLDNKTVQQIYQREALLESMRRKWRKVYTQIVNTNGGVKKTSSGVHRLYTNSEFFRP